MDQTSYAEILPLGPGAEGIVFPDVAAAMPPEGTSAIVTPRQTHTCNVAVVTAPDSSFPETDALISACRDIAPGVRTADCVPVLLHAPDIRAVAAIHAGWKGTVGKIAGSAIERLRSLGADPTEMFAAIGPSVCGECYEVSPELALLFSESGLGAAVLRYEGRCPHLDLRAANRIILTECGIPDTHIHISPSCTCHTRRPGSSGFLYPSWRREQGTDIRLLTIARLLPA